MTYTTVISTAELARHLDDANWVIVDCRFALDNTERGLPGLRRRAHSRRGIRSSRSRPIRQGRTGRNRTPSLADRGTRGADVRRMGYRVRRPGRGLRRQQWQLCRTFMVVAALARSRERRGTRRRVGGLEARRTADQHQRSGAGSRRIRRRAKSTT